MKSPFKQPKRYKFWLNIYPELGYWKCLNCEKSETKVKKLPLVISVDTGEKKAMVNLNMSTKYCPYCDLIVAKEAEIITMLSQLFDAKVESGQFFVMGTLERKDWSDLQNNKRPHSELFDLIYPFKKVLDFTVSPAGWYYNGK